MGDAWATRAWYSLYPHTDFFATVGHFLDLNSMNARPANAVYRVALNGWFGADTQAWYTWQIASCVGMSLAIYALLREIGLSYLRAAAVALLLALFPASASLWFWSPVVHASLAISLGAIGFLLALRAFAATGRTSGLVLHGSSLLLFVLSLLLYEICLPLFLASFLLYARRAPRRAALRRWLLDCAVLLPMALMITGSTEARDQGIGGSIDHAGAIAGELPILLFGRLLPLGPVRPLAFVALAAVYVAAFLTSPTPRGRRSCPDATGAALCRNCRRSPGHPPRLPHLRRGAGLLPSARPRDRRSGQCRGRGLDSLPLRSDRDDRNAGGAKGAARGALRSARNGGIDDRSRHQLARAHRRGIAWLSRRRSRRRPGAEVDRARGAEPAPGSGYLGLRPAGRSGARRAGLRQLLEHDRGRRALIPRSLCEELRRPAMDPLRMPHRRRCPRGQQRIPTSSPGRTGASSAPATVAPTSSKRCVASS